MLTIDVAAERTKIRAALDRRSMLRAADALTDQLASERKIEREAMEAARQSSNPAETARGRKVRTELAIAKRRDALKNARQYRLTGEEIDAASVRACLRAKVPMEAGEDRPLSDVVQAVSAFVIRRHGPEPLADDVSADWLRQIAAAFYLSMMRKAEKAIGARATAQQLRDWQESDRTGARSALAAEAHTSGDLVYALAAGTAAPEQPADTDLDRIAAAMGPYLSRGQIEALRLALDVQNPVSLNSTQRTQWERAIAKLRASIPNVWTLRLMYRDELYAASLLWDAAKYAGSRLAKVAMRGNGRPLSAGWQGSRSPRCQQAPTAIRTRVSTFDANGFHPAGGSLTVRLERNRVQVAAKPIFGAWIHGSQDDPRIMALERAAAAADLSIANVAAGRMWAIGR